MGLGGHTVLVIGGSSGIGAEVARRAAAAQLVLAGRDGAELAAAATAPG